MKASIEALFIALLLVAFTCSAASADHTGGMWGTCPWALDDAGTLTIGTEGARTTGADTGEDGDRIPWKNVKDSIREVAFLGEVRLPADSGYLFSSCHSLRKIDFGKIDTSNVTNLCGMFWGCHFLRGDTLAAAGIGGWDVSGVTDMSYLFCGCEISFDSSSDSYGGCLDLNGWDTAQVTNMSGMFSSAFWRLEEIRFDGWDTSNVTDMSGLFREAFSSRLAVLDLGGWNTSSAVNMESMFLETYARKVTLGNAFSFCGAKSEPQTQLAEEIWETGGSWMSEKTGVYHTSANIASNRNNLYDTYTFSPYLTWDDLSFHFGNLDEYHLSDYTIPFELYEVFMPYGKAVAHYSLDKGRWNGSCAGFAAAAVLLNDTQKMLSPSEFCANAVAAISPLSKSDAFSINKRSIQTLAGIGLSEVTVTRRMTLTDLIDSLYLGQFRFKREYKDNLDLIVKEVIAGKIRHELPILSIRHGATSSSLTSSGHVLVPYDVVEEGNEARMYVYDCNFPGYYEYCRSGMIDEDDARAHFLEYDRNRYIRLEKSADGKYTKWYYHTNDEHHWGTDYPVSSICLIKNSSLREVWNNRYEDVLSSRGTKISPSSDDVWIYVKSETFTIKDASGDTVARLESGGSFTTFGSVQDEIELLVGLDRADDGLNHLISLPKGEYTVQTPDGGVEIVTAHYGGTNSLKRQIMNQADYFYYSGHGRHSDGCLKGLTGGPGLTPALVAPYWNRDLKCVVFAGCSVLDINDYNGKYVGTPEHGSSPGKLWAAVEGPESFLGYAYKAPRDTQGAGRIASDWVTLRGNINDVDAWMTANDNSNGRNACAIDNSRNFHYFKKVLWKTYKRTFVPKASQ